MDAQQLLKTLECPACLEYMHTQIYLCENGHSICSSCKIVLNLCCLCRDYLTDLRNYTLEHLAEVCQIPCWNGDSGCGEKVTLPTKYLHDLTCVYRDFACQLSCEHGNICSWMGQKSLMAQHCIEEHPKNAWMLEDSRDRFNILRDPGRHTQIIRAHGELFYLTRVLSKTTFVASFIVSLLGSAADAESFIYQIQFEDEKNIKRTIKMTEACCMDTNTHANLAKGYCVMVPLTLIETYADKFKNVWYIVNIKHNKPIANDDDYDDEITLIDTP